jgi:hypothetical protein
MFGIKEPNMLGHNDYHLSKCVSPHVIHVALKVETPISSYVQGNA